MQSERVGEKEGVGTVRRDAQADLALLKAATPGPWRVNGTDEELEGFVISDIGFTQDSDGDMASEYIATVYEAPNAAFSAACPEMVEHYINRAVEAEKALGDIAEMLDKMCEIGMVCSYPYVKTEPGDECPTDCTVHKVLNLVEEALGNV
jgi:hypothetical protein